MSPTLPQSAGYGVVIGMGLFFSVFMLGITKLQTRYTSHQVSSAEEFTSASRSVKPGLIAAGIVSAWTWAATLLQSSAVAYKFGISGPWWYASGACVQVLLFAMISAKMKQNAPKAHTFLEVIRARWGKTAHLVFMAFGLATNVIVSTMLILGGSATVTDLTGMSTIAACFLIPVGVAIYVVAGGMRATLIADYSHTAVLFAIILTFVFTAYANSPIIGSFKRMYTLLQEASAASPVAGNAHGSYLTMRSKSGLIFGVINVIGNFATVFNDQAYYQRAIASRPDTAVKAFLLGGLSWFCVPFAFATTLGLAAVALSHGSNPLVTLTASEVSAGLPAPKAAAALLGTSGATAMLILLFLAVTSATSAELIAVSSIATYDVYGTYINKQPTERQILWVSHVTIAGYAVFMGGISVAFHYFGISMGWLYEFMGLLLGGAVVPIAQSITSRKANPTGCIVGALSGLAAGIIGWLVATAKLNNSLISVETTFGDYEMLTGNLLAIGVSGIISLTWTWFKPHDFDWEITRQMSGGGSAADVQEVRPEVDVDVKEKLDDVEEPSRPSSLIIDDIELRGLQKAFRFASLSALALTLILLIIIPLPLFFSSTVFGLGGFTAWVVIGMIWIFCGGITVVLYPLWESRDGIAQVVRGIYKDVVDR